MELLSRKINLNPNTIRPINFKFGDYLSKGIDLYKNNFGVLLLAFIFVCVMCFIPFCALPAIGNYYKICQKLHKKQYASASEVFNFDDFGAYFIFQLIIIALFVVAYIPMIGLLGGMGVAEESGSDGLASGVMLLFIGYILLLIVAIYYFMVKIFYYPMLISFLKIRDFGTVWKLSSAMAKGNFWQILAFSLVVGLLAQIGTLACYIGVIFTLPLSYTCQYFAFEDAWEQISYDEIEEIGKPENE